VATLKKVEADERRPSRELAERLAEYLAIPADQRQRFIESARGVRPVDHMPLADEPTPLPRPRSNLPRPLTSFIGREKEIQQVENLVSGARLVTITGSGGVGKTRLAIQVARGLTPYSRMAFRGLGWLLSSKLPPPPKKGDCASEGCTIPPGRRRSGAD
jgi:hypothetical protein